MSRIYWHAKERTAELHGSERAWLRHIAEGPARVAWDLDRDGSSRLERAAQILSWHRLGGQGFGDLSYLHQYLRDAQAEDERHTEAVGANIIGTYNPEPIRKLISALTVCLRVSGLPLTIAGVDLNTANIELNTALAAGSDPVRIAAKIHGWCESHCWVEGPDRK